MVLSLDGSSLPELELGSVLGRLQLIKALRDDASLA